MHDIDEWAIFHGKRSGSAALVEGKRLRADHPRSHPMRYAPPGMCLNDFAVLGQGPYVVLHLQGPWTPEFDALRMETSYGRARSHDLVAWEPLGPVFGVGLPGRFDDSAVWTMHPFPYGEGMAMAYSGVTLAPDPRQAIGMAFSDRTDGTGWVRAGTGPVTRPDPRWYRTGTGEAWRDPWVVRDAVAGAKWAMLTAARTVGDPLDRAGCVGLATSDDLEHWQIHPSPLIPGDVDELECPILEPYGGGWLLIASIAPARHIEAWWSADVTDPWERLGPIAPAGPYAPRLVDGPGGERLLLHTVPRRVGLRDDGPWCRGMLAQPKVLRQTPYGPRLAWWPRLESYLGPDQDDPAVVGDAVIEIDVDDTHLKIDLCDQLTVGLAGTDLTISGPGGPLQAARLDGSPARIRVLAVGEYIEVYADDVLALATASYAARTGRVTPAARVRPLHIPGDPRDDASALWPGA
jgi:sucrose-6-phosphate hydrolase SacC (GH32 family)